jgi:amino acid permease
MASGTSEGTPVASTDILVPNFQSPRRKSPLIVATFNLSATVIGGGVLSLPYAFSKTGLLLGTILMVIAAIITERSLYLLCLCARITGATSYAEVGEAAFGPWMEYLISCMLGIFLIFVIIAYMVLAQDIWTSVILIAFPMDKPPNPEVVLLMIVTLIAPFLIQETLHALRFNCYVGFSSVSILCLALVHHAWISTSTPTQTFPSNTTNLLLWPNSLEDVLIAFPIITLSFLSIFNVLPIQNGLLMPTRIRMLTAIDGAMSSCLILTLVFGAAGYIYAGSQTDGNILNNCHSESDMFLFVGQLGCGITVVLAMPMMLLPCRASLLEVLDVLVNGPHTTPIEKATEAESQVLLKEKFSIDNYGSSLTSATDMEDLITRQGEREKISITRNKCVYYASSMMIVVTCFIAAINVPGVDVVWSIIGCFMGFLLSFMLPCACYLKIQTRYPGHALQSKIWIWFSWTLLVGSMAVSTVCTLETITRLLG